MFTRGCAAGHCLYELIFKITIKKDQEKFIYLKRIHFIAYSFLTYLVYKMDTLL